MPAHQVILPVLLPVTLYHVRAYVALPGFMSIDLGRDPVAHLAVKHVKSGSEDLCVEQGHYVDIVARNVQKEGLEIFLCDTFCGAYIWQNTLDPEARPEALTLGLSPRAHVR